MFVLFRVFFCIERFCHIDSYLERKVESLTWRIGFHLKFNYLQFVKMSSEIEVAVTLDPVGIDPRVASMFPNADDRVVR